MNISDSDILAFAKAALVNSFEPEPRISEERSVALYKHPPLERVNVTLRTYGRLRGSMSSDGSSLADQVDGAVLRSLSDGRFGMPITKCEIHHVEMEVWLQIGSVRLSLEELQHTRSFQYGIHGLEIAVGDRVAYYKPTVPFTSHKRSVTQLLAGLCKKAGLPEDLWRSDQCSIKLTSWHGLSMSGDRVQNPLVFKSDAVRRGDLEEWMQSSALHLTNNATASGKLTYMYNPLLDRNEPEAENAVRLAGALYSLSALHSSEFCGNQNNETTTLSGIANEQIKQSRLAELGSTASKEGANTNPLKIGTIALLALGLGQPALRERFSAQNSQLVAALIASQKDNGRFATHVGEVEENLRSSEFSSGQVLLALLDHFITTGDQELFSRIERAFPEYQKQFVSSPSSAFAGWHVEVWSRMARLTGESRYVDFVFLQARHLLHLQQLEDKQPVRYGGFLGENDSVPTFSSIVFLESIVHAYSTAVAFNRNEAAEEFSRSVHLGLSFCRSLRIDERQRAWFPNWSRAQGGITLSPLDKRIRCDLPQHMITLCLAALRADELL